MDALALPLAPADLGLATASVLAAGFLRAYSGFGFALAVVPLLSQVMDPVRAVPVVLLLEVASGLQLLPRFREDVDWSALRLLLPAAALALPLGLYGLSALPPDGTRVVIALAVLAAVVAMASGFQLPEPAGPGVALGAGALSGLLAGGTAMSGPPVLSYFLARPGPREVARASMLMFFLISASVACLLSAGSGILGWETAKTAVLLVPALALGNVLGQRQFTRSRPETYRRVTLVVLSGIALATLAQLLLTLSTGR